MKINSSKLNFLVRLFAQLLVGEVGGHAASARDFDHTGDRWALPAIRILRDDGESQVLMTPAQGHFLCT